MANLRTSTVPQQVADHLRELIRSRRWKDVMPGRDHLAQELGVSPRSVQLALKLLEKQGVLISQGPGKQCRIATARDLDPQTVRVQILLYDKFDAHNHYMLETVHQLQNTGHIASFATKDLQQLKMDPKRVARFVEQNDADAWIICAGSKEVLTWFAEQAFPAFALFGRSENVPLPSAKPHKAPAEEEALKHLLKLGHRSIVRLAGISHRKPTLGTSERQYLKTLEEAGITTSRYHLPDWEESREGVHGYLDSVLKHTPPTAMVLDTAPLVFAAYQHLTSKGFRIPEDISLISSEPNQVFDWGDPQISHISYDTRPIIRCVLKWADSIARGKDYSRKAMTKANFVIGGTTAPPGRPSLKK